MTRTNPTYQDTPVERGTAEFDATRIIKTTIIEATIAIEATIFGTANLCDKDFFGTIRLSAVFRESEPEQIVVQRQHHNTDHNE